MAEEIEFENRHFQNFKSQVTLTLTSDDLESHIIVNVSLILTNSTIWFVAALCFIVDIFTVLPGLLCHLSCTVLNSIIVYGLSVTLLFLSLGISFCFY